jgi:N-acyl-D-aspartate/D-glutamate deacylase
MGSRGVARAPATPEDIEQMAAIAREAIEAGALGFTTSRTINHRSISGEPIPTLRAGADELLGIARAIGQTGRGVVQFVSDRLHHDDELDLIERIAAESGRPLSLSVAQHHAKPDQWRTILDRLAKGSERGLTLRAQVAARAVGIMTGLDLTLNPFMYSPDYKAIADLPLAQRVARMREPSVRRAIIEQMNIDPDGVLGSNTIESFGQMFRLGAIPNYEPNPADSVAATAQREGRAPGEVAYDWLLEADGRALLYTPFLNWHGRNLDVVREMLMHPAAIPGLSDGGAHVGTICDVSFPTTLLQWWGRDRPYGRIPLERLVSLQSRSTAMAVGLADRGLLATGHKADVNIIDFDALRLHAPEVVHDLPAGGRRLLQRADGYRHTLVNGIEIMCNGQATGELPGKLLRGAKQPALA